VQLSGSFTSWIWWFFFLLQGPSTLERRLEVASLIYSSWTERGTDETSLASHFLDGSMEALQNFVTAERHDESMPQHPADGKVMDKHKMQAQTSPLPSMERLNTNHFP
jgi:hypothetical protein